MSIPNVSHVVLPSRNPEASAEFYERVLQMERVAYLDRSKMVFLSFGKIHHDVALVEVDEDEAIGSVGNAHTGVHIDGGVSALTAFRDRVIAAGVPVGDLHDFDFMSGFYFADPDGNTIEVFCDVMDELAAFETLRGKDAQARDRA